MSPKKLTKEDKQEILNLYRHSEATTSTLATRYGVSSSTISRFLKNNLSAIEYEDLIQQKRLARTPGKTNLLQESIQAEENQEILPVETSKNSPIILRSEIIEQNKEPKDSLISAETNSVSFDQELQQASENLTIESSSKIEQPNSINRKLSLKSNVGIEKPRNEVISESQNEFDNFEVESSSPVNRVFPLEQEINDANIMALEEILGEDISDLDDLEDDDDDLEDDDEWEAETDRQLSYPHANLGNAKIKILPISAASFPKICYIVVDRSAELIARPLENFADLGKIPKEEFQQQTLPIFDNHRVARRFSHRRERVIKVPDGRMLQKTSHYLQAKGITRLLIDGQIYSLSTT